MATDYTSLIMKDGAKLWTAKPPKPPKPKVDKRPEKRRNGALANLDLTLKALAGGTDAPRGWVFAKDDLVLATLRTGSREIRFPGGGEVEIRKGKKAWGAVVPKERAVDFYKAIRPVVADGKLDTEIAAAWEGNEGVGGKPAGGAKRAGNYGWSEERKAKFKATQAAKKAARAAK